MLQKKSKTNKPNNTLPDSKKTLIDRLSIYYFKDLLFAVKSFDLPIYQVPNTDLRFNEPERFWGGF